MVQHEEEIITFRVFYNYTGKITCITPVTDYAEVPPESDGQYIEITDIAFVSSVHNRKVRLSDYYVRTLGVVDPELCKKADSAVEITKDHWISSPVNNLYHHNYKIYATGSKVSIKTQHNFKYHSVYAVIYWCHKRMPGIPAFTTIIPEKDWAEKSVSFELDFDLADYTPTMNKETGPIYYEYKNI